jgi:hypothetical protein
VKGSILRPGTKSVAAQSEVAVTSVVMRKLTSAMMPFPA